MLDKGTSLPGERQVEALLAQEIRHSLEGLYYVGYKNLIMGYFMPYMAPTTKRQNISLVHMSNELVDVVLSVQNHCLGHDA